MSWFRLSLCVLTRPALHAQPIPLAPIWTNHQTVNGVLGNQEFSDCVPHRILLADSARLFHFPLLIRLSSCLSDKTKSGCPPAARQSASGRKLGAALVPVTLRSISRIAEDGQCPAPALTLPFTRVGGLRRPPPPPKNFFFFSGSATLAVSCLCFPCAGGTGKRPDTSWADYPFEVRSPCSSKTVQGQTSSGARYRAVASDVIFHGLCRAQRQLRCGLNRGCQ